MIGINKISRGREGRKIKSKVHAIRFISLPKQNVNIIGSLNDTQLSFPVIKRSAGLVGKVLRSGLLAPNSVVVEI